MFHSAELRRRQRLLGLLGLAAGCLLATLLSAPAAAKPNVLLILADDLGFSDLGCFGSEIDTPHLDSLAQQGLRLTGFYNAGRCCPSRASLLTGQYAHRVGLGHMVKDLGQSGYRGTLSPDATTIAQVLQGAGYRCYIAGKWHLGTLDPTQHGFLDFYGTLASAQTYWDADHLLRLPAKSTAPSGHTSNFYATDAVTDQALAFIADARSSGAPWFLYLAYHAPHFPLQARPEDISRYVDRYRVGWDEIRKQRLTRMKGLGIVPQATELSPRSPYTGWLENVTADNPAWDTLSEDRQADLAHRMAIYAAMVHRMDHNIGRMVESLRQRGELDQTLILFLSDNGACAEWDPYGFDGASGPENRLHIGTELASMGRPGTYHSVGSAWANAANTPWRFYKHYAHEGGISTPGIVSWPQGIHRRGQIEHQLAHVIDVLPTLAAVADADALGPLPPAGINLLPMFLGKPLPRRPLFFEHEGHRAVHYAPWKLTAERGKPWQLFEMTTDRTELHDLSARHPDIVEQLSSLWQNWAHASLVLPFPHDYDVGYLRPAAEAR